MKPLSLLVVAAIMTSSPVVASSNYTRLSEQVEAAKTLMSSDPAAALAEADDLIAGSHHLPQRWERSRLSSSAYRLKAEALLRRNELENADHAAATAIDSLMKGDARSSFAGDALLTRGGVHSARGEVAAALADYQTAFHIFVERNDIRSQAIALVYISDLYNDAHDSQSALRYLQQARALHARDPQVLLAIANGVGSALNQLHHYNQANDSYEAALRYAEELRSPASITQVRTNIAKNLIYGGSLNEAWAITRRMLGENASRGDPVLRSRLLGIAAEVAFRKGMIAEAGKLIELSFTNVDLSTTNLTSRDAHYAAYRIFSKLGRPKDALAHLEALKRLEDEAARLATTTSTALMAARFDFANQELRIANLRADDLRRSVEAEQAQVRFERTIFAVVAVATMAVIALLAWLLFTIRRSRDRIRAARDDLALTNAALGKALAAKTEFLATTSHEIRTPLNGILGMTQVMLADRALAPNVRERLGVVHTAGTTMRALVDDILDVAKMESGNLVVEEAPFNLREALRAATLLWEAQCRAKGLTFLVDLDACPTAMLGDAARVRQVIFNLLANAVKFTSEGSVTLRALADHEAGMVAISVADSGIGIAVDQQHVIFDAFRQADASTTRRFGGTGLGLSISRSLAEAMGGSIRVDSAEGEGATFTLTLPLFETMSLPPITTQTLAPDETADLLIVERSPIARAMWRSLLAPRALTFAGSVDEAVEAVERDGFAAMLIDDATIGADPAAAATLAGVARAGRIRCIQLWPASRGDDHPRLLAAGTDVIVARPFARETLVDAIENTSILAPLVSNVA